MPYGLTNGCRTKLRRLFANCQHASRAATAGRLGRASPPRMPHATSERGYFLVCESTLIHADKWLRSKLPFFNPHSTPGGRFCDLDQLTFVAFRIQPWRSPLPLSHHCRSTRLPRRVPRVRPSAWRRCGSVFKSHRSGAEHAVCARAQGCQEHSIARGRPASSDTNQ